MFKVEDKNYTIQDFKPFFKKRNKITISPKIRQRIQKSHQQFQKILSSGRTIYGVNTGFGALSDVQINKVDLEKLQLNLVRSHAAGTGRPFDYGVTRVIMLLKIINFSLGYSGIRWEVIRLLQQLLNHDILPVIPSKGSVGASGDLAPLAHMTLTLIGEGEVHFNDRILPSMLSFREVGLEPLILGPKEGLSLINGTQVSTALAILGLIRMERLLKVADVVSAMSVEAELFSRKVFRPQVHRLKKHIGQLHSATNIWHLLEGSEIVASHKDCGRVQDPYSFRCIPHVHGASREMYSGAKRIIENEINSVSDNPVLLPESQEIAISGHFHGEIVAQAMDSLSIAASEIGAISERRIATIMKGINDKIPMFLADQPGLESGFMMAHVTAASLASESKSQTFPSSVDSISTSASREDFVSMAPWSGRKLLRILENVAHILGIELLISAHALDLHRPLRPGIGTSCARNEIRKHIKFFKGDKVLSQDIESAVELIRNEKIVSVVEKKVKLL